MLSLDFFPWIREMFLHLNSSHYAPTTHTHLHISVSSVTIFTLSMFLTFILCSVIIIPTFLHFKFHILMESIRWLLHFLVLYLRYWLVWFDVSAKNRFTKGAHEFCCPERNSTYVVVLDCHHLLVPLKMGFSSVFYSFYYFVGDFIERSRAEMLLICNLASKIS